MEDFKRLALLLKQRHPQFELKIKEDSPAMSRVYRWTGMRWWNPTFMSNFTTTIGYTVYMPLEFIGSPEGYKILRHEAVHVEDYSRFGILFWLSYLLVLPAGLTLRSYWEMRGYAETMRVEFEETGAISDETVEWLVWQFYGPNYLWMLPIKPVARWFINRARKQILQGKWYVNRRPA